MPPENTVSHKMTILRYANMVIILMLKNYK